VPSEPKRKRHQVKLACMPCRKRHSACEDTRPCKQCIKHGLQDQCTDKPRQKRRASIDMGVIKQTNPVVQPVGETPVMNGRKSWSVDFTNMNMNHYKIYSPQKNPSELSFSDTKVDGPSKLNKAFDHCQISSVRNWKYPTENIPQITRSAPSLPHQTIIPESLSYDSNNDNNNHCVNLQNNNLVQPSNYNLLGYKLPDLENFVLNNNCGQEAVTLSFKVLREIMIDNAKLKKN